MESYAKANRMLGLVKRTIRYRHPKVLINLYKTLVRPHLEYSMTVWNPHYQKDKILLERVQHLFTRRSERIALRHETGKAEVMVIGRKEESW